MVTSVGHKVDVDLVKNQNDGTLLVHFSALSPLTENFALTTLENDSDDNSLDLLRRMFEQLSEYGRKMTTGFSLSQSLEATSAVLRIREFENNQGKNFLQYLANTIDDILTQTKKHFVNTVLENNNCSQEQITTYYHFADYPIDGIDYEPFCVYSSIGVTNRANVDLSVTGVFSLLVHNVHSDYDNYSYIVLESPLYSMIGNEVLLDRREEFFTILDYLVVAIRKLTEVQQ